MRGNAQPFNREDFRKIGQKRTVAGHPQIFLTPDLGGYFQVHGIGISLANDDWIFFSEEAVPNAALLQRNSATYSLNVGFLRRWNGPLAAE